MDPQRFDAWTKALASGSSRRGFLFRAVKAGIAAVGLTAVGDLRAGRAAGQDEDLLAKCRRKLEQCAQRKSFPKCSNCVAKVENECSELLGTDVVAGTCRCDSHADCDDGNACTLDLCSSEQCHNISISSDCVECRGDRDCPDGGVCCQGRCCPAGSTCQVNAQGIGICCEQCDVGDKPCCEIISYEGGVDGGVGYLMVPEMCVEGDASQDLPSFCCRMGGSPEEYDLGTSGRYIYDDDGNVIRDPETGAPAVTCVLPVSTLP
jgi:hypothetical protein